MDLSAPGNKDASDVHPEDQLQLQPQATFFFL